MKHRKIKEDLYWLGVKDPDLKRFDIVVETEYGSTYNSYLLKGSQANVLIDTVKLEFLDEFLIAIEELVPFQDISYIIVNHTEPDHAGSVEKMLQLNPDITLIGTPTALKFLKEIINMDFKSVAVKENDTLSLGDKTLQFFILPNLHWPDTMFTFYQEARILFTCDFFGAHFCPQGLFLSELSEEEVQHHKESYKYYYDCIMSPFPKFIEKALKRLEDVPYEMVCNGHGPILDKDLDYFKKEYESYIAKTKRPRPLVVIPYVSSYGYTRTLAKEIAKGVADAGDIEVRVYDVMESDRAEIMDMLDQADGFLLGSPTFMSDALKPIWDIATDLNPIIHGGKLAAAFGSYGWTGEAVLMLTERLKNLRMKVMDGYRIRFKPSSDETQGAYAFGLGFGRQLLAQLEAKR